MTRKIFAIWLCLVGSVFAVDGLPSGVPFDLPVVVNGKTLTGKALIQATEAQDKPLVVFYVGADNTLQTLSYTLRRADSPNPQPDPKPNPDPKPLPPSELLGIVVEESSQRVASQALVLSSADVRGLLAAPLRIVDKDQAVTSDLKPYLDRAKTEKLPVLFLTDKTGKIYYEGPLPATAMECADLIRRKKGGGK